ncbi:MAG: two-component sensor histidine kinase [Sulfurospirillum sp.]|nr:MAG: two-component sensor histidine kinase [Sulfurospirillum sp.]
MFSKKSIKRKFLIQLIIASATLIAIFSIVLYNYIRISMIDDITKNLQSNAKEYIKEHTNSDLFIKKGDSIKQYGQDKISVIIDPDRKRDVSYEQYSQNGHEYITIYHIFDKNRSSYLKIQRDITGTKILLSKILKSIIFISFLALFLILAYAMFLSETLLYPIKAITRRLSRMNESFLEQIDLTNMPDEFVPLGESVNKLIERIQNFVKYQKELFIGTAHELKTPLAVMKTKNEVTLIKDRDVQKYKDTLKVNNQTIDEMNKMISSILEVGRQEGAQFEKPVEVDLIQFLKDKTKDFSLLAKGDGKKIEVDLEPEKYCIISQPTLLTHILQNFVQNAIKFSPKDGTVKIRSRLNGDEFTIEILDEGEGIDESKDLFAPFKRDGNKAGAGLGLFLAKGAADAIGAEISLKNRKDSKGAVAKIVLNSKNYCPLDDDLEDMKISIFSPFKKK